MGGGLGRRWRSKRYEIQQVKFRWVTLPSLGRETGGKHHIPECVVTNKVLATGLGIRQRG